MLANGSSLTEANHSGDTALHLAAYGGHRHLVEWLLVRWGASITQTNKNHISPLLAAAHGGQMEMAKWLLQNGAPFDEGGENGHGWTHPVVVEFHVQLLEHGGVSGGAGRAAKRARRL